MDHEEYCAMMTDMVLLALDLLETEVEQGDYAQARAMLQAIGINTGDTK